MKMRIKDPDNYRLNDPRWVTYDKFTEDLFSDAIVGDSWNDTDDFVPYIQRAGARDIEVLPDFDNPNKAYCIRFTMPPYNPRIPGCRESWLKIMDELMEHAAWGKVYQEEPHKIIVSLDWKLNKGR